MTDEMGTALVTGGARRIGRAIVEDLARNGFAVAIHCRSSVDVAEALADDIRRQGGRALVLSADLADAAQLPADREGLVVNMVDQRAWKTTPHFLSYQLSKSGLLTATRTLAQALAPRIRVNAIGPGPTLPSPRQDPAEFRKQAEAVLLRHGPDLCEFGRTIRYLYETRSITGQMIALDGGQHLAWETPDIVGISE